MEDFKIRKGVLVKYAGHDHNVVIPEGVTEIGIGAFEDCRFLESVTMPGSVTVIGERAFRDCGLLESLVRPVVVTKMGNSAFY